MKAIFKPTKALLGLALAATIFTSCSDDNSGIIDGGDGSTNYSLTVKPSSLTPTLTISSSPNKIETVKVRFEGADKGMRRLYITKNDGTGRVIYDINTNVVPPVAVNNDDKSIDLSADNKQEFTFDIPFDAPKKANDVVVYKLWATKSPFLSSKGDIENEEFRNAYDKIGVGTIVIKAGSAIANYPVKEFSVQLGTAIDLYAPDLYGKTKSFVSILTGETYLINRQGKDVTSSDGFTAEEKAKNAEYVSYWDFGYFYLNSKGASLSSANDYMNAFQNAGKPVVNITNISGLTQSSLNKFYFKKDNAIAFDGVKKSGDLDKVSVTSASPQTIQGLKQGDVLQFLSGNGVKGLIKIDAIKPGTGNKDYIKFSVKVQNVDYIKL